MKTVTGKERQKALLGWAAKSSAWVEPNAHFPFVVGAQTTLTENIAVQYWRHVALQSIQTLSTYWLPLSAFSKQ